MSDLSVDTRRSHGRSPVGAILFDDFLGSSINPTNWTVFDRISDQVNSEQNCVVPANVSLANSVLSGLSKFEDHSCGDSIQSPVTEHYTSWQMQQATAPFLYGTIAVRAKMPGGTGLWPCLWLLGFEWQASQPFTANTPEQNGPHGGWCEIDIAEFLSANGRSTVHNAIHFETNNVHQADPALPYDATSRFMVYRLQWTAGSAIFSVDGEDGVGFRTLSSASGSQVPNVPMYVVFNCAVGGAGGAPNSSTFPQTYQVDWVRVTR